MATQERATLGERQVREDPRRALVPIDAARFGYDQARHLLWRAGFGGTPAQISAIAALGPERAVDFLLESPDAREQPPAADLFDRDIMRPYTAEERRMAVQARSARDEDTLAQLRAMRQQAQVRDRRQMREIQRWWLTRMIETPRPLEEKMVLFWHGHFATSYRTIEDSYHMYLQNQRFRTHALGNYGTLLREIIRDPAMLAYLDNNDSRKGRPNENLARELMELFSMGVGTYSESDIKEGARALTGYTFVDDEFVFNRENHDTGPKRLFGKSGAFTGDDFVEGILAQRATSTFMTRKLYAFFVGDLPEDAREVSPAARVVLEGVRTTFTRNRFAIKPVLRQLFLCQHFYSDEVRGQRIKSPVDLVVGGIRELRTPVRDTSALLDALSLMGQNIFYPPSVAGWAGGRSWINTSTMFVRQNTLAFLLTGQRPDRRDALADRQPYDARPLLDELEAVFGPGTDELVVERVLRTTLGRVPTYAASALLDVLHARGGKRDHAAMRDMLLLVTAMPEYQLC
ncbi:MAG: DUF1800 domain-containing protein [Phycisphaeraceae bacterium]|nr:DUF1800 domain-containing protein [Phycisphaeraceae bacterium]